MDQKTKTALRQFFAAQNKLNQQGIIRSRDYVGDVGLPRIDQRCSNQPQP